jgi:hypothetical protein
MTRNQKISLFLSSPSHSAVITEKLSLFLIYRFENETTDSSPVVTFAQIKGWEWWFLPEIPVP